VLSFERTSGISNDVFNSQAPFSGSGACRKDLAPIKFIEMPKTTKNSSIFNDQDGARNCWKGGNQNSFSGYPAPLDINAKRRTFTRGEPRRNL
jgi:hypothetical protein